MVPVRYQEAVHGPSTLPGSRYQAIVPREPVPGHSTQGASTWPDGRLRCRTWPDGRLRCRTWPYGGPGVHIGPYGGPGVHIGPWSSIRAIWTSTGSNRAIWTSTGSIYGTRRVYMAQEAIWHRTLVGRPHGPCPVPHCRTAQGRANVNGCSTCTCV